MLWSCRQGDTEAYPGYTDGYGKAVGMPYAWHHPLDTSYDCFIGFKDASIPLSQGSIHNANVLYSSWLFRFIYYGTYGHLTIMQSLDQASLNLFGRYYSQTELNTGFTAVWPGIGTGSGWMKIYGNSGLYFY